MAARSALYLGPSVPQAGELVPWVGSTSPGPEDEEFLRTAYHDIPLVVPAIREFWVPERARSWSAWACAKSWSPRNGYVGFLTVTFSA
jgi:hypothetical protein